jgi:FkbM family methyltransferase
MNVILLYIGKLINRIFSYSFQRFQYFNAWNYLYRISLTGMGRIQGNPIEKNGEMDVLKSLFNKHQHKFVVFDVGANKGQYLDAVLHTINNKELEIHVFDPSVVNAVFLNEKLSILNNSKLSFKINTCAISNKSGDGFLFADEQGSDIASLLNLKVQIRPFNEEKKELVKIITIDEYLANEKIDGIDLLKIDIEGGEYDALKGAEKSIKNKKIKHIQFEFGPGNITARKFFLDFWELLSDDYHFYQVMKGGILPIKNYNADLEIFKTANYLLILK